MVPSSTTALHVIIDACRDHHQNTTTTFLFMYYMFGVRIFRSNNQEFYGDDYYSRAFVLN
jgi:hypothetical protein